MNQVIVEKTQNYLVVKIPLKAVRTDRADLSMRTKKIIDESINEGLRDIVSGRIFGPFKTVKEFKMSLKKSIHK